MEKGGYPVSEIYQGGYSSITPPSENYVTAGSLGLTTDARTANILQEVSTKLSTGVKHIEVEMVSPEIFDSVPKQQLKEVNRLSKLTGIDVSMHGPVVNVSGITQQGFSEADREASERKVAETLLRSHELDPKGNMPVNFHSAEGIPGSQLLPPSKRKEGEKAKRLIVVNKDSGRMTSLEPETIYYPVREEIRPEIAAKIEKKLEAGKITPEEAREKLIVTKPITEKGEIRTPEQRLDTLNRTEWDNTISQLIFNKERADEILEKNRLPIHHLIEELSSGIYKEKHLEELYQKPAFRHYKNAETYLHDLHTQLSTLFSKAYEFGNKHQKEILISFSKDFQKQLEKAPGDPFIQSQAMHNLLHNLKKPQVTPEMWVPVEDFALDTSSKTFGNAAFESYKELKGKSPILVIENPPAGFALSTGEDIKNMVIKSREQFVKKAVEKGISKSVAKTQAEKLIGATWDLGHINMLRKYGYSEKEIIEESKKVAPYVKHVHLSDNFGYEHTELPMGMGNVPMKEIMKQLGEKGKKSRKIIEALAWWQHFKTPPVQETLEATGSPVYAMKMAPYWNQAPGLYQGYMAGLEGPWLPKIHYETFGTSFARLPAELGGQMPGAQGGRMSGAPME